MVVDILVYFGKMVEITILTSHISAANNFTHSNVCHKYPNRPTDIFFLNPNFLI